MQKTGHAAIHEILNPGRIEEAAYRQQIGDFDQRLLP
jgi:hypothetical protein